MRSDKIDYGIIGDDMQVVQVYLDPGETVIAEAGALIWMDDGIKTETKSGDGSKVQNGFFDKIKDIGTRVLSGESLFITHFTNVGVGKKKIVFGAGYPGKIKTLNLGALPDNKFIAQRGAFLSAAKGTSLGVEVVKDIGGGFFGGEGFVLQKIEGDGTAFIHAGGNVMQQELNGEKIKVDTGCLVGFTGNIDYRIERSGDIKTMMFGNEGIFLATLQGHGTVYLQSLPFSKTVKLMAESLGSESKGNRSIKPSFRIG